MVVDDSTKSQNICSKQCHFPNRLVSYVALSLSQLGCCQGLVAKCLHFYLATHLRRLPWLVPLDIFSFSLDRNFEIIMLEIIV